MTKPYGLLADLHLHNWSAFSHTLPLGINSRLEALLDEIERAAIEVKAAGGRTLIFAGDVFHVRGSVAPSVFNPTRDRLAHIHRAHGVEVIIMPGNHDLEGRDSTRLGSAVTGLEMEGVLVTNQVDSFTASGLNVVTVPWIESIEELKKQLQSLADGVEGSTGIPRSQVDVIIHAPIDGVIEGLPAHGLQPDFLASLGFKRVFAGHYHNHRQMHPGFAVGGAIGADASDLCGQVWSIGALAHHTWSDIGSRAGFLIVHPDRVDWRKSHLPEFLDLSRMACEPEELPLLVEGNFVRVRVEADKLKEVEKAKKELLDMGAREVLVQAEPKPPIREGTERATVKAGASLEVQVGEFVAKGGVRPELAEAVSKEALSVLAAAGVEE